MKKEEIRKKFVKLVDDEIDQIILDKELSQRGKWKIMVRLITLKRNMEKTSLTSL